MLKRTSERAYNSRFRRAISIKIKTTLKAL